MEIDEAHFMEEYHSTVNKGMQNAWHDFHIKKKQFSIGNTIPLYERKLFLKHSDKLLMHLMGPFIVAKIRYLSVVKLMQLDGIFHLVWVNVARLKTYISNQ